MQQSLEAGGMAGSWQLAPGRALSLYPRSDGVLRITRGRAWATQDIRPGGYGHEAGDHDLQAGEQLLVRAGRHLVFESFDPSPLWFEWVPTPVQACLPVAPRELRLTQAWGDVCRSAAQTGRALLRLFRGLLVTLPWLLGNWLRLSQR